MQKITHQVLDKIRDYFIAVSSEENFKHINPPILTKESINELMRLFTHEANNLETLTSFANENGIELNFLKEIKKIFCEVNPKIYLKFQSNNDKIELQDDYKLFQDEIEINQHLKLAFDSLVKREEAKGKFKKIDELIQKENNRDFIP